MKKSLESAYRVENGKVLIELELKNLHQLFNTFDPAPFHDRDIDADAEEYIVGAAQEISPTQPIAMIIYLSPADAAKEEPAPLAESIRNYFHYRLLMSRRELRLKLRQGRDSLLVGLLFLAACIAAQSLIGMLRTQAVVTELLREGLIISGWVGMWRPVEIFLYGWRPIRTMSQVYQRLSRIEVEIRPSPRT